MAANNSGQQQQQPASTQPSGLPSSSTFSFKAPFPVSAIALKHRRVSLASPSSPRLVQPFNFRDEMGLDANAMSLAPEKKGKMRKIDVSEDSSFSMADKKPRKKWSAEETQMLVQGCQLHGVGNWKTILQDPTLKFHDRSAVDLKDRFRTYFPDAYKKHYPNARTHLSSRVRSTLSDGTPLFEKTRSKKRRPFTDAEDRALKAGYEKHGTTWATIVKDPIFQEQSRRSTDLRDRFRNAFPDLYQAAGYKPRTAAKKKLDGPLRAADDQLPAIAGAGPVRSRRRAQTSQGLLRGGTKSVPQSAAVSEDEESSAGEEEEETSIFKTPPTPVFVDNVSTGPFRPSTKTAGNAARDAFRMDADVDPDDDDAEMQLVNGDNTDALHIPDFLPNHTHTDMDTWSAGLSTPTHSSIAAWSTAGASPSSSHIESASSDFLMRPSNHHHGHSHSLSASASASAASSPFLHRRGVDGGASTLGMIGKSAWGEDWFSPNPRLESRNSGNNSDAGGTGGSASFSGRYSPPSPWSFSHAHLNGGVLDRYDLFPPSMPDAPGSSDTGLGDGGAFGDELGFGFGAGGYGAGQGMGGGSAGPSAGGTGFKGYHSQIAGDLISGASSNAGGRFGSATATSAFSSSSFGPGGALSMSLSSLSGMYSTSFSGSSSAFGAGGNSEIESGITGLGLEGIPQNTGIHPMQLHSHTPSLLAIDELELTGISLNDHDRERSDVGGLGSAAGDRANNGGASSGKDAMETTEESGGRMGMGSFGLPRSPMKHTPKGTMKEEPDHSDAEAFGLDDLVDMGELHATPPATPLMTQPRPMRRAAGALGFSFDAAPLGNGNVSAQQHHARSISVPPGEARNGGAQLGMPMSMDDVGLHMHHGHINYGFFNAPLTMSDQGCNQQQQQQHHQEQQLSQHQHRHPASSPMRLNMSNNTSGIHSPISPVQQQQHNSSQLTPLFPGHLILSPSSSAGIASPSSPSSVHPSPHTLNNHSEELWRSFAGTGASLAGVDYSLPFLDLHYYGHASYGAMALQGHPHGSAHLQNSLGLDVLDEQAELASSARQGQAALDLAQSAASMGGLNGGSVLGLGLPLRMFDTPSPVGTIRHHVGVNGRDKAPLSELFGGHGPAPLPLPPPPSSSANEARGGRSGDNAFRHAHSKGNVGSGTLGRSMSHHRGQSAVCPQDLMLRNDNKRKRASWDGGAV
ncbi:hypothetical protein BDN70DRAFT_872027 [Pholiota conissans]|uniref:Meiotically up-regulated gene 152 protein n=1 Tax=Pholiota conissans TaxID=109636 RepID=A0A9P5ZC92_9AGAR|nr:hypothetical protein BDN70DRAFT_872027 [Pholiota conissans]